MIRAIVRLVILSVKFVWWAALMMVSVWIVISVGDFLNGTDPADTRYNVIYYIDDYFNTNDLEKYKDVDLTGVGRECNEIIDETADLIDEVVKVIDDVKSR